MLLMQICVTLHDAVLLHLCRFRKCRCCITTQLDGDFLSTDAALHRMTSLLIVPMQMLHCNWQRHDVTADCSDADASLHRAAEWRHCSLFRCRCCTVLHRSWHLVERTYSLMASVWLKTWRYSVTFVSYLCSGYRCTGLPLYMAIF